MAQSYYSSNQQWAMAIENCFVGKQFPATIQSIQNAKFTEQNAQNYWTGILKKESIMSKTDMSDISTNPPMAFAYVEQKKQTFYVRFANEGDSKRSLCSGDNDKFSKCEVELSLTD
ncbi:hypothetical protein MAR_019697 [Mya arenaria]|uniref:Uncharacterized protein n=2 Tax=Mya arenaria TaxID=6604 RepID=A0ABY7E6B4_MYAAR|nr:hypothetical protein MAR_019697 [Mya arenaria]